MVPLTQLESDILGDLVWDDHSVGEVVPMIRSAYPMLDEYGIYRELVALLESWIQRGWLTIVVPPTQRSLLSSIDQLLPYLAQHGPDAIAEDSEAPLPQVTLTEQAFRDVEWLRGVV
jgi:hypothetical protein